MKAIQVKYLAETERLKPRLLVKCEDQKSLTIPLNHPLFDGFKPSVNHLEMSEIAASIFLDKTGLFSPAFEDVKSEEAIKFACATLNIITDICIVINEQD